jgi:hypothetical protein
VRSLTQKKTYAPGNWITRGTESPTRDLRFRVEGLSVEDFGFRRVEGLGLGLGEALNDLRFRV